MDWLQFYKLFLQAYSSSLLLPPPTPRMYVEDCAGSVSIQQAGREAVYTFERRVATAGGPLAGMNAISDICLYGEANPESDYAESVTHTSNDIYILENFVRGGDPDYLRVVDLFAKGYDCRVDPGELAAIVSILQYYGLSNVADRVLADSTAAHLSEEKKGWMPTCSLY